MSFRTNLARGRSHIVFVLGLLAATATIWSIEGGVEALAERPGPNGSSECPPAGGEARR